MCRDTDASGTSPVFCFGYAVSGIIPKGRYPLLLTHGNNFDFNKHLLGKLAHGNCRTCGERRSEHLAVNLVHRHEISHIRKENGGFNNVVNTKAGFGKNCLYIGKRLGGLSGNPFGNFAGFWINGNLS